MQRTSSFPVSLLGPLTLGLLAAGCSGPDDCASRYFQPVAGPDEARAILRHDGWVTSVAFTPDGRFALTGGTDEHVRLWRLPAGEQVRRWDLGANVWSVDVSPDGRTAVAARGSQLLAWTLPDGVPRLLARAPPLSSKGYDRVAFGPDGSWVLTAPNRLCRVSVPDGEPLGCRGRFLLLGIETFDLSPDGRRAATTRWFSRKVRLRDLTPGSGLTVLARHDRLSWPPDVEFSPDGGEVLSGGPDAARVSSLDGEELLALTEAEDVWSVAYGAGGELILTGTSHGVIEIWERADGRRVDEWTGHRRSVIDLVVDPAGRQVLSASEDCTARLWDLGRPR